MKALSVPYSLRAKKILKNMEGYQRVAQNIRSKTVEGCVQRIERGKTIYSIWPFGRILGKEPVLYIHGDFAELFTMETQGDSDLYFVKTLFPELWDEYQKLF